MLLSPGTEIDRYVIVRLLGSGGMGDVYEARDTRLQRRVALKLLHVEEKDEREKLSEGTSRLLREARLAAALEHPNVVAVYDAGEVDRPLALKGAMYLAMELIAGTSLRSHVGDKTIPVAQRIRWMIDAARALGAAHARGMVHRDVKPENVMIRDDGVVKVLDFGIAKQTISPKGADAGISTLTAKGIVVGTPHYMAPEQMRGEPLDGRADQFAWGVTAYELLTGDVPWSAKADSLQLVAEVLSKEPPLLSEKNVDVPLAVAAVVRRALAKDREHRFPSMGLLIAALEGREVPAEGATPDHRSREELSAAPTERMRAAKPATELQSNSASLPGLQTPRQAGAAEVASARTARLTTAILGAAVACALLGIGAWFARGRQEDAPKRTGGTSEPAAPRECETSKQCIATHGGAPFVCHDDTGTCAPLESEDCKLFAEPSDLGNDRTIWIGTMFSASPRDANPRAIDLARRDFAVTTRGIVANGTVRPLSVIACDDQANPERAATHLVRDVRAPAVIGFSSSNEILDLGPRLFLPGATVVIAATGQDPLVTRIPQGNPRLVWRLAHSDDAAASAIALFIPEYVEPDLRKRLPGKRTRLAVLGAAGSAEAFSESLHKEVIFNGRSASENGDGYRQFSYSVDPAVGRASFDPTLVKALVDFAPNVVVFPGTDSVVRDVVEAADRSMPVAPVWITPNELPPEVFRYVGKDASRRQRFFGIGRSSGIEANGKLVAHFNEVFPGERITAATAPASAYDAFYLIAYASYALGDAPVTGTNLARAFQRLQPPGSPIPVGPSGILDALEALRSTGSVDLDGASGHLDFDLSTGESTVDLAVQSVGVDGDGHAQGVPSGIVFDASTKRLGGTRKTQ